MCFCAGCSRERQGIPPAAMARENTYKKVMVSQTMWGSTEAEKTRGKFQKGREHVLSELRLLAVFFQGVLAATQPQPSLLAHGVEMVSPLHCLFS